MSEHVLVVDDEPMIRWFAARVLREEGFDVREATDGEEALELIRAGIADLDVVLSDIVMPRMNGGVLGKPFSPEALASEVRRCIRSLLA